MTQIDIEQYNENTKLQFIYTENCWVFLLHGRRKEFARLPCVLTMYLVVECEHVLRFSRRRGNQYSVLKRKHKRDLRNVFFFPMENIERKRKDLV